MAPSTWCRSLSAPDSPVKCAWPHSSVPNLTSSMLHQQCTLNISFLPLDVSALENPSERVRTATPVADCYNDEMSAHAPGCTHPLCLVRQAAAVDYSSAAVDVRTAVGRAFDALAARLRELLHGIQPGSLKVRHDPEL